MSKQFKIIHELKTRIRILLFSNFNAPLDEKKLNEVFQGLSVPPIVTFNFRTQQLLINYSGLKTDRSEILKSLKDIDTVPYEQHFSKEKSELLKQRDNVILDAVSILLRPFTPNFIKPFLSLKTISSYFHESLEGLHEGKLDTRTLDFSALLASFVMKDYKTVSDTAFLLGLGEYLEEQTKQSSKTNLSSLLESNIKWVWILKDGVEQKVHISKLKEKDIVIVNMGSTIPVDGKVLSGEAYVNQSFLTGESQPVFKSHGKSVYARTILEEGRLEIEASSVGKDTKLAKIINMIEDSSLYRGEVEDKSEQLANKLVPAIFGLSGLTFLLTGNAKRAASLLLVDYSCALKLSTPLAIRQVMIDASNQGILIKGGKYLEKLSKFDTVVLDKTGTLTQATPSVAKVYSYNGFTVEQVIKESACLEEHFPHPVATAVTKYAEDLNIDHDEEHTEIKYMLAHGISATLHGEQAMIGSSHFVNDHGLVDLSIAEEDVKRHTDLGQTILYFSMGKQLKGIIAIEDPIQETSKVFIDELKNHGIKNIIMLTGDGERTAKAVANKLGITEFYADVRPDGKKDVIEKLKAKGNTVVMIGDGMNDSLAISSADIGIAMGHGSDLAKETSNVILLNHELFPLISGRDLSNKALKRIKRNNKAIISFNTGLLLMGMGGRLSPSLSSFLHNGSTILVAANSMRTFSKETTNQ